MLSKQINKELQYIGIIFVIVAIIFKIVFFKENLLGVLKLVFALFWIIIIPGWAILLYWHSTIPYWHRLLLGTAVGASVVGIISYYIGLLGVHISTHWMIIPLAIIISCLIINRKSILVNS